MSYVDQTLGPKERYLLRAQFNWTYSVDPWFWALMGFAPLLWASFWHGMNGVPLGKPWVLYGACVVPACAGAALAIAHFVHLRTTEIAVTSTRFVYKTGLISRQTKEVSLNNIEEINLQQSVLGRMFDFGHMTIRGTGVGVIQLPDIDNPIELRRCIEAAKAELRGTQAPILPVAPAAAHRKAPVTEA